MEFKSIELAPASGKNPKRLPSKRTKVLLAPSPRRFAVDCPPVVEPTDCDPLNELWLEVMWFTSSSVLVTP